jgi:hypothetical protein
MAMHKYEDLIQPECFWENLGDAAVRIDLLRVKPSHTLCINLGTEGNGTRESSNKGMIMYVTDNPHNYESVLCYSSVSY